MWDTERGLRKNADKYLVCMMGSYIATQERNQEFNKKQVCKLPLGNDLAVDLLFLHIVP